MLFFQIKETTLNGTAGSTFGEEDQKRSFMVSKNVLTKARQNVSRASTEIENFCS